MIAGLEQIRIFRHGEMVYFITFHGNIEQVNQSVLVPVSWTHKVVASME